MSSKDALMLCPKCGGNGVLKIPGGVSECDECNGLSLVPRPKEVGALPLPQEASAPCTFCDGDGFDGRYVESCPRCKGNGKEPMPWTAEQEVEAAKQQLPNAAWRTGASLARCVEDLRMERDLYRGTLVGLLPVLDADPCSLADRVRRFIQQALRASVSQGPQEAPTA